MKKILKKKIKELQLNSNQKALPKEWIKFNMIKKLIRKVELKNNILKWIHLKLLILDFFSINFKIK